MWYSYQHGVYCTGQAGGGDGYPHICADLTEQIWEEDAFFKKKKKDLYQVFFSVFVSLIREFRSAIMPELS